MPVLPAKVQLLPIVIWPTVPTCPAKNAVITGGYAAADANMRDNEAVFAQYIVMAKMYKIINFSAGAYNCASCSSPVDAGIAADFNLVLQHNIACLQNEAVFAGLLSVI